MPVFTWMILTAVAVKPTYYAVQATVMEELSTTAHMKKMQESSVVVRRTFCGDVCT